MMKHLQTKMLLLVGLLLAGVGSAAATYKLEQVTSVEAGSLYVFEQDGHVMNNTVTSNSLQTTSTYATTGLNGTESYIWTLEATTTDGTYKLKNASLTSNQYLNYSSSTSVSLGSGSNWVFTFQDDKTVLIQVNNTDGRFLGYTNVTSFAYKAYAISNLSSYNHAINVYKLVEGSESDKKDIAVLTSISPTTVSVGDLDEFSLTATFAEGTVADEDYEVSWTSSDPTILELAGSTYEAKKAGTVTVTVSVTVLDDEVYNEVSKDFTVIVKEAAKTVSGLSVDFETNNLDSYVDWTFTNIGIHTATIAANGGTYYGANVNSSNSATTTASIMTKEKVANPGTFICYVSKESNNTTASNWKVQVSSDGSTWTDVATASATSMSKGTWTEVTADLTNYTDVYVQISYSGSNAIRAIDDISITEASAVAVKAPVFSVEEGTYTEVQSVEITCETEGAAIYYTVDGTEPTDESNVYAQPITINATTTLKAIAYVGTEKSVITTATYTVNIPTIEDGVFDFTQKILDYGSGVEAANDGQVYITEEKTWTAGNVTLVTAGKYRWWSTDGTLRFYSNNNPATSMTLSVPAGKVITKIVLTGGQTFEANVGSYKSGTWTGEAQIVVLTYAANSGSINVKTITVTYGDPSPVVVSVGSTGYATFCSEQALDFSEVTSIEAYIATVDGSDITFTQVKKVPAQTGVLLRNPDETSAEVNVPVLSGDADDVSGNALVGVLEEISSLASEENGKANYILNNGAAGMGFYKAAGKKVAAGKAYLQTDASEVRSFIGFGEETGISDATRSTLDAQRSMFDLQGRRVQQPVKGLYIVNGKKVVLK